MYLKFLVFRNFLMFMNFLMFVNFLTKKLVNYKYSYKIFYMYHRKCSQCLSVHEVCDIYHFTKHVHDMLAH